MRMYALPLLLPLVAGCGANALPDGVAASPDLAMAAGADDRVVDLPQFSLQPGEEKILCAYVPPDNVERYVNRFTTDMTPGSHHLIVFRVPATGGPATGPEPCNNGLPVGMLPGAQEPHTELPLPPGIAYRVGAGEGLYFQMHYINATPAPITAHVTYRMGTIAKGSVKELAGELFYSMWNLKVPTGKSTQEQTCKAPYDMNLTLATGHMHKHGLTFDAAVNGQPVYHTSDWDSPQWKDFPAPGYQVKQGDAIHWACNFDNETGAILKFGDSAEKNEMCIFVGLFWPAPNSETLFVCQK